MNYQAYAEYKEYKSIFLTEMPADWRVKPLHTLCEFRQGKAHEPYVDDDGQFICVNARFVSTQGKSSKYCNKNLTPANLHDVLMVMSDLPNGRALARAFFVKERKNNYAVNQRICAITASRVDARFLYYQLDRSPYFLMYDDGSNQTHLSNDAYKKYPVLLPSIEEQKQIAAFLDRETAKIDTLIDKQKKLIALLKEKRQATISHAVTKGLNPNAPMKDSGIPWLGKIPKNWKARQLKFLCTYNDEVLTDSTYGDYEIEYVDIGSVSATEGILKTEKMRVKDAPSRAKRIVRDGDVIISTVRTYLEAIAPVDSPPCNLIVSTGFAVIRPNKYLYKGYAAYCLRASGFIKEVVAESVGVSYPAINASDLVNIKIPEPSPEEQKQIAEFLDMTTTKIDKLISKAEQAIELIKERRTALISAAVTGKIDVRDACDVRPPVSHPTGGVPPSKSSVHGDL